MNSIEIPRHDQLLDDLLYREPEHEFDADEEADDPCLDEDGAGDY